MKNFLFTAAFAASLLTVCSCSNDNVLSSEVETGDQPALLDVTTSIEVTRSVTGRPIDAFTAGDELGLFVSSGAVNTPYNGVASNKNVKSSFTTVWTQATPVYLSSRPRPRSMPTTRIALQALTVRRSPLITLPKPISCMQRRSRTSTTASRKLPLQ